MSLAEIEVTVEAACPKVPDPYLYRVDKDGITSWLLGTRHVSVTLGKFPPKVLAHLRSAKTIVFEIAPDAMAVPPSPYTGRPLRELLGEERWNKYRALVGDPLAKATVSPISAFAAIASLYENKSVRLEAELAHAAEDAHVPAQGLETRQFQHDAFTDTLGDTQALETILDTATRPKLRDEAAKALRAYCAGTEVYGHTAMDEKMLVERNRTWLPKLETLHAAGGAFIAVGGAHLPGPDGVVQLLQADGYSVTRTLE